MDKIAEFIGWVQVYTKVKVFVMGFFRFVGLTENINWFKDFYFYMALFLSFPVKAIMVELNLQTHVLKFPSLYLLLFLLFIAFSEELFFRGFLMPVFSSFIKGNFLFLSYSNIVVSFLFSISHIFTHNIFWSALVFFPSLVYGYFREKYGSILPSIVLHFVYNLIYFC